MTELTEKYLIGIWVMGDQETCHDYKKDEVHVKENTEL